MVCGGGSSGSWEPWGCSAVEIHGLRCGRIRGIKVRDNDSQAPR